MHEPFDDLEELLIDGVVSEQFRDYIRNKKPIQALNLVWPQLLEDINDPRLNMLVGIAYCHAQKNEDAELYLKRSLEKQPDQFLTRYFLSRALFQQGKNAEALEELEEILRQGNEDARVYQGISILRAKLEE